MGAQISTKRYNVQGAASPVSSCVSLKSYQFKDHPSGFSFELYHSDQSRNKTQSSAYPESSCVSMKSDWSKDHPPGFSGGSEPSEQGTETQRTAYPESSCVSMRSDWSKDHPPGFNVGPQPSEQGRTETQSTAYPESSCVSMKSDWSKDHPPGFSGGPEPSEQGTETQRTAYPESSCVSMRSDWSKDHPPGFNVGPHPSEQGRTKTQSTAYPEPSCLSMKSDQSKHHPPGFSGGPKPSEQGNFSTKAVPNEKILAMGTRDLQGSSQPMDDVLQIILGRHKTSMKSKNENLFEGIKAPENRTFLNRIYTRLYIIEGESEGVNEEHEVLQMEKTKRKRLQDSQINCSDIFKPLQTSQGGLEKENIKGAMAENVGHKETKIERSKKRHKKEKKVRHDERKDYKEPKVLNLRTVLTKGIAGIGKTISVQKFILDWAEGKANQDVDFMFVLPFRELNLIKDDQYSLHELLCVFHPELRDLNPNIYDVCKAVFIFDGLDESRIPLEFGEHEKVSDITMTSSVSVLMTNLIRGDLLPSALIWITCRPAAAYQIPPQFISRVTEIQGFSDQQKEEYFRKRISDQDQVQKIISHIKTTRSLHIMCHIPIFCWISATVLQRIMEQEGDREIPKTLTEMYSHFLLTQINMKKEKYEEMDERDPQKLLESNRTMLLKLAELAFKQLMEGNVMFYEEDLREIGIDVTEASVRSGIFTEILKEECVIYQRKVYCFVHLSFQEFLAALYVVFCYQNQITEVLEMFKLWHGEWSENAKLEDVLCKAVNKAVHSRNGRLDLFLRFLLGISLESNQKILQGLLTPTHINSESLIEHIKTILNNNDYIKTDRFNNLFLCLSEMKDQSFFREIRECLKSERPSAMMLSRGHCSALAYMILTSEEVLDELDLKKFNASEMGYRRLAPALAVSRRALLADCHLGGDTFDIISSTLQSVNYLKELDLSNNDMYFVTPLCVGLKSSHCKLEILRLSCCKITSNSCEQLASALQSVSSLKDLDLSKNDLQDSGVELISTGLMNSYSKLEKLRLDFCSFGWKACTHLGSVVQSENLSLKDLDLSNNDLQDMGMDLLSAGLKSTHCKLEIIRLSHCSFGPKACKKLASVLQSVNSSLKDLDLSSNDLQDSGVALLSTGLKSSHCKLETLRLSGCMITKKGCSSLASTLKSNHSHLRELDLAYNHPGKSGVNLFSNLLQHPHCKLETVSVEHGGKIRMKTGLKKYACYLTLDPNTAHPRLCLSEGNRKVERVRGGQPYPDHPDRFKHCEQVLSMESLTEHSYWEAEWSGRKAGVAVSYRDISRKGGRESQFGKNKQSWSLVCTDERSSDDDDRHTISHGCLTIYIRPPPPGHRRVAVYLDQLAGTVSFYSISPDTHTLTNLHTFHRNTFRGPLHAGFWVYNDSSFYMCEVV